MKKSFSQQKVNFIAIVFVLCIIASYILAWYGKEPVENLSMTMAGAFTVAVSSYFAKSAYEKNSLNKNGLIDDHGTIRKADDWTPPEDDGVYYQREPPDALEHEENN